MYWIVSTNVVKWRQKEFDMIYYNFFTLNFLYLHPLNYLTVSLSYLYLSLISLTAIVNTYIFVTIFDLLGVFSHMHLNIQKCISHECT